MSVKPFCNNHAYELLECETKTYLVSFLCINKEVVSPEQNNNYTLIHLRLEGKGYGTTPEAKEESLIG
jgi:hypothetical protein